ncbi:type 1 glutamine amidotransferase [Aestuariimicrobium sp. T2.26MG-19.2B]|uniref:type 1 glutamine amidotransferase n=1 Tax=Aestuariimicrobium sp. T2.26MG-19.2B TaxID=3040679 RepID=UPI0024779913|nr:glutamine amidotransferase [Aestuariimicrobium sp. T2.26MG-19.2B]CAI9407642.1 Lipid II isoglutaminyl synthase (glutamine-hydrolyzing) subunit GatD [Aestuariimicrobium sp. T2.26MG-19.2B]
MSRPVNGPVKLVLVYQSLLGIYGDRGNATVLAKRLEWRGIDHQLLVVEPGEEVPADGHVYLLGGGEDLAQISAVKALRADGNLFRAVEAGAALFAVCAGYQICGTSFTVGDHDQVIEGLGLLDVSTRRGPIRAVGEILTRWQRQDGTSYELTGFENHGGHTTLGADAVPLARVEVGVGNNGDGTEGTQQGTVIGTYPHGPVLARNPELADHVLRLGTGLDLDPLAVPEVDELRRQRIAAVRAGRRS